MIGKSQVKIFGPLEGIIDYLRFCVKYAYAKSIVNREEQITVEHFERIGTACSNTVDSKGSL